MTIILSKPHRAVDFKESAIKKALERAGSLDVEIKYDGVRVNIMVNPSEIALDVKAWFQTRESKPLASLDYLWGDDKESKERWDNFLWKAGWPKGLMIDGEAMVKGVDFNTSSGILRTKWSSPENFNYNENPTATLSVKKSKKVPFQLSTGKLQVVVYAMLDMDTVKSGSNGSTHAITRMRTEALVPMLQEHFPEIDWVLSHSTTVYDMDELNTLYQAAREDKQEGLIVLDPLGEYQRGKKTGMWKMKPDETIDGTVVGLNWGTEGLANEGKVIGFDVLLENGMVVAANNISQALMEEFTNNVQRHNGGSDVLFLKHFHENNPYHGHQCEVSYMEMTPDGSLRHPSFKCWRGTEDNPTEKM